MALVLMVMMIYVQYKYAISYFGSGPDFYS